MGLRLITGSSFSPPKGTIMSFVNPELANRYAAALFDLADEKKDLDGVSKSVDALAGLIGESDDLRGFLANPILGTEEKAKGMGALINKAGMGDSILGKFVGVVAAKGRLSALPAMLKAFQDELAARRGDVTAVVTSAEALSADQAAKVEAALSAKYGAKIRMEQHVDPSLLGGMTVRVGSTMVDSSLSNKLTRMKAALLK